MNVDRMGGIEDKEFDTSSYEVGGLLVQNRICDFLREYSWS